MVPVSAPSHLTARERARRAARGGASRSVPAPLLVPALIGLAALAGFIEIERRSSHPLIPLDIFASRQFTAANLVTFALYAALGSVFFLLAITLTATTASRTAPAALSFFTGASQFAVPTGSISAAAVVITIPIIIFVLFFQRRIVAGLTAGAVQG